MEYLGTIDDVLKFFRPTFEYYQKGIRSQNSIDSQKVRKKVRSRWCESNRKGRGLEIRNKWSYLGFVRDGAGFQREMGFPSAE